jgi:hypothetical protein
MQEVATLRTRLSEKDAATRMKELCIRMMYCEMLGHPVEFGYIHAVNMTQRMTLAEKKTGYLAASLFLGESSELLILLVNTLQRDLRSQNPWEVCAALSAVTRLIGAETIPAVLSLVKECFTHQSEHVRKKAVMALHRFLQKSPDTVTDYMEHFKRAICDRCDTFLQRYLSLREKERKKERRESVRGYASVRTCFVSKDTHSHLVRCAYTRIKPRLSAQAYTYNLTCRLLFAELYASVMHRQWHVVLQHTLDNSPSPLESNEDNISSHY